MLIVIVYVCTDQKMFLNKKNVFSWVQNIGRSEMFHQGIFWRHKSFMALCALFLPFNDSILSHHSSIQAGIAGALRYSSSFSMQNKTVTQNMKMGEKSEHNVIDDAMRVFFTNFHALCDEPFLH